MAGLFAAAESRVRVKKEGSSTVKLKAFTFTHVVSDYQNTVYIYLFIIIIIIIIT